MGWVYLDDRFPEHPKVVAAGDEAGWMFTCGMAYVNRNGTGGIIPKAQVPRLTSWKNPAKVAERLVAAGLWHDEGAHYRVHDYADWNRSALERTEKAKKAAHARWDARSSPSSNAQASAEHVPEQSKRNAFPQAPIPNPPQPPPTGTLEPAAPDRVEPAGTDEVEKLLTRWLSIFTTAGHVERERSRVLITHLHDHLSYQAVDEILGHAERDLTSPPRRAVVLMSIAQSWASEHGAGRIPPLPGAGIAPPSRTHHVPNQPARPKETQP